MLFNIYFLLQGGDRKVTMTVLTSSTKFILNILKCYIRGLKSWRFWMNVSTSHVMNPFVCSKRIQKLLFHAFPAKHFWLALSNTECAFSSPILQLSFWLWNYIRDNRWERNPSCVSKLSNEAVYSVKPSTMLLFSFNVFVISIGSCWHRVLYNLFGSVIEDSENVFFLQQINSFKRVWFLLRFFVQKVNGWIFLLW